MNADCNHSILKDTIKLFAIVFPIMFLLASCSGNPCPAGYIKLDGKCYEMGGKYVRTLAGESKI